MLSERKKVSCDSKEKELLPLPKEREVIARLSKNGFMTSCVREGKKKERGMPETRKKKGEGG